MSGLKQFNNKKQFKCQWPGCGNEFQKEVERNSQVRCNKCGNYLKQTDGTKIEEPTNDPTQVP